MTQNLDTEKNKKSKLKMPDTYVFLFLVLLVAAIATYILPAGSYDREEIDGITRIIGGTYSNVESSPVGVIDFLLALHSGYVNTGSIIFMIIFTGAALKVVEETGAVRAGIFSAIRLTNSNPYILIIFMTIIFGVAGGIGILSTQVIPFVLIGVILCRAIKLDAMVAVAITFGASYVGWAASFINPFTVGIAQTIAEVPLFSGVIVRLTVFIIAITIYLIFILYYVRLIINNPKKSLTNENGQMINNSDHQNIESSNFDEKFTITHKLIILFSLLVIAFYAYAVLNMGWGIDHMSAIVILIALGSAVIGRMGPNKFVKHFMEGAQGIIYGALVVGISNAIIIVLEDGSIVDTIVYGLTQFMIALPSSMAAVGMFIANTFINFFIPSGSGQAFVTMPIMTPVADMVNITRQTAVQAYQFGDGFSNMIFPTSGPLMASLAIAGVSYGKWLKWIAYPMVAFVILSIVVLVLATIFEWGPL